MLYYVNIWSVFCDRILLLCLKMLNRKCCNIQEKCHRIVFNNHWYGSKLVLQVKRLNMYNYCLWLHLLLTSSQTLAPNIVLTHVVIFTDSRRSASGQYTWAIKESCPLLSVPNVVSSVSLQVKETLSRHTRTRSRQSSIGNVDVLTFLQ